MILVTGSNGMVGSHLLYNLASRGIAVRALLRNIDQKQTVFHTFSWYTRNPEQLMNSIEWVEGDITDLVSLERALEGVKKVYHTAALVSFNSRMRKKIFETNIRGTANIVNLCIEKNVEKLCFVSSIAALGSNENGAPVTEDILWKPSKNISAYSLSKYHSEMEVWRGITEGLNAVIINPSVILGPGDWSKGSPSFFEFASKGLIYYTPGTNGFVDVRDVAEGMIKAMESNISGERFILSSENISYKDFFTMLNLSLDKKPPTRQAPFFLMLLAQKWESLRSLIFNHEPKITKDTITISQKKASYSAQKSIENLNMKYRNLNDTLDFISQIYKHEKFNHLLTIE
jgi:dihydroflavonol-4-reductase